MTVINDTRVVRLQRTAARTGHQHSGDERIVETVTLETVTVADVVSLPPGSLISLQRGPAQGHTEEGSILNATFDDIGGVAGGQTTSVSFWSEDGGVTSSSIFVTELDFSASLTASGQYAINYKTFQIKTYDPVPTTPGSRIQVNYTWAPIREFLIFSPEDLIPDLEAFGSGPHQAGGGDAYEVIAGCGINVIEQDGYKIISTNLQSIAGDGLIVSPKGTGCNELTVDLDAYQVGFDDSNTVVISADNVQEAIEVIDGYLQNSGRVAVVHKYGSEAEDPEYRSIFSTDGYEFPIGEDRLVVSINGLEQVDQLHYVESSSNTITFNEPLDVNDEVIIRILPGSLGVGASGVTDLQGAYNNSLSGAKSITLDDGQLNLTQTESTGSVMRLTSNSSVTTALDIIQNGSGEGARIKSISEGSPTMLLQKDASSRNSIINTFIVERTTSHVIGSQSGIGSGFLTRLENTGGNQFNASRIVTGTESAADSAENTYLSIELSDDGVIKEYLRLDSNGKLGVNTSAPEAQLHVQGDGYFSEDLEVFDKIRPGSGAIFAPINIPIFDSDPVSLENGDLWATDIGGTRELKLRIAGVIYSVILT